ncbi:MAG TPA: hypothetical protein VFC44_10285 [Candidatus Saccharimonadales bacterium]|nr:hypothetical protein [Candidatus Saccharimonadales bacterium]
MKLRSLSVYVSAGALCSLFVCGINRLQAASPIPLQNAGKNVARSSGLLPVKWEEAKAEKLRHAYRILERGDHDYKGHRLLAMHQIEAAAKILGVDLHGEGRGHEKQLLSDVQLHEAKHALEDIVDETHGKERQHIRKAIGQIDTALAIR